MRIKIPNISGTKYVWFPALVLTAGFFVSSVSYAETSEASTKPVFTGFYSREGNNAKMAEASGHNEYVKFYPEKRITRLYIPYPYAKSVKPAAIRQAFAKAIKETTGSAYVKSKFGVMDELIIAHLDFYHWVDNQVMYDCDKPKPCRVEFKKASMTVIKPGIVLEHKIHYNLVSEE